MHVIADIEDAGECFLEFHEWLKQITRKDVFDVMKTGKLLLIVFIFLIVLFVHIGYKMPRTAKESEIAAPVLPEPVKSENDFSVLQRYHITKDILDEYEDKGIVKYGRNNPMSYFKQQESSSQQKDGVSSDDEKSDNPNEAMGSFTTGVTTDLNLLVPVPFDVDIANLFRDQGVLPVDREYFFVTSGFGVRYDPRTGVETAHLGIDIARADERGNSIINGKSVYSVLDGTVYLVRFDNGSGEGYGNLVVVNHGKFVVYYGHQ